MKEPFSSFWSIQYTSPAKKEIKEPQSENQSPEWFHLQKKIQEKALKNWGNKQNKRA
ncbi:hypothetical protein [Alkalihalobacillus trypoxylicola]|uniref:hypothetical protein n=1 Tax=Alkalihalobacillus trypoxylicola TaxID=519424 RepID=UPI000A5E83A8|nr:hypothetical protein [Alkalihalobacillus trypoxylicola]